MMTIEISLSDNKLTAGERHDLAERVLHELTTEPDAPDSVMDKMRELTHVMVRTPEVWATGGPSSVGSPRYLVRITVPGVWSNNSEFGGHVIAAVTRAIAAVEPDPERLFREPHCVVQIIGLREHTLGTLGRTMTSTEITKLMTEEFRKSGAPADAPEGYAIDPVCGMTVERATAEFTLTHDGVDYAFCAPVCRKLFAEEHAVSA